MLSTVILKYHYHNDLYIFTSSQQDGHEFLESLLNGLHEEVNAGVKTGRRNLDPRKYCPHTLYVMMMRGGLEELNDVCVAVIT